MPITIKLESSWQLALKDELCKSYISNLKKSLESEEVNGFEFYPPKELIFNAFQHTPFNKVKVVIVGQDPYHGIGQAHGLSFSVPKGVPLPPSLKNIFKEIEADIGGFNAKHGDLISWADQGVLLLNSILTVRKGQPASHQKKGWEQFTDAVLMKINENEKPCVFLLWGKYAQEKGRHLNQQKHLILKAAHPSPFSAYNGFFGCKHFSKANQFLEKYERTPINWHTISF
ncbi:MAG: Uracil-DNA glycosylase [Chlamydiae bacterium]|nr:Uracil-DNA glycosylase [Chlamydiota bacterium]